MTYEGSFDTEDWIIVTIHIESSYFKYFTFFLFLLYFWPNKCKLQKHLENLTNPKLLLLVYVGNQPVKYLNVQYCN